MKEYYELLYKGSAKGFYEVLEEYLLEEKKKFIITANPEIFMKSTTDSVIKRILLNKKNVIVPDGISIVKTANTLGYQIKERITGIDISSELLKLGNEHKKKIYLYGSKEEVCLKLKDILKNKYPNLKIVGLENGYDRDYKEVFSDMLKKEPDIVLVAFGVPRQEKMINEYIDKFNKGIFVGVGGSFDVLSGSIKRAPKIFIKLNLEWLYRIIKEPKRLKRFYQNNIKFMLEINKIKKENRNN